MSAIATRSKREMPAEYYSLVRAFPLRVLVNDADHEGAVKIYSRLVGRKSPKLSSGERQYARALARFIQDYEEMEWSETARRGTPLERLTYLMEESRTTPGKLGEILTASQPLVSMILGGKRQLTVPHIRLLADYFKIDPAYFI